MLAGDEKGASARLMSAWSEGGGGEGAASLVDTVEGWVDGVLERETRGELRFRDAMTAITSRCCNCGSTPPSSQPPPTARLPCISSARELGYNTRCRSEYALIAHQLGRQLGRSADRGG